MNKTDLVNKVADRTGMTKKDAERALTAIMDTITEALAAGEKVQLVGFGTFEVRERAARVGHNPATHKEIQIAASKAPAFKPGQALKNAIK